MKKSIATSRTKRSLIAHLGSFLLFALIVLLALSVVGTIFSTLPYLRFGQLLLAWLGPWIVLLSAFGLWRSVHKWRGRRFLRDVFQAACAAVALVGSLAIVTAQLLAIRDSGTEVSLVRSLYFGPVTHHSSEPEVRNYTSYDGVQMPLAIYRPSADVDGGPAPVLIYIHGGGWVTGAYRTREADLRWYADQGLVVVTVEYALSNESRALWDVTQPQIGCALAWVAANIGDFGGDPGRIALTGDSAGGNLAINAAYMANAGTLGSSCTGQVPRISAVAALYPVIDVAKFHDHDGASIAYSGSEMAAAHTGGTPRQFPERYAHVSSPTHITAQAPATLVIVGGSDSLVPAEPAYAMRRQATQAGIDFKLIDIPYAGHSFEVLSGSITNQLARNATMDLLLANGMTP